MTDTVAINLILLVIGIALGAGGMFVLVATQFVCVWGSL